MPITLANFGDFTQSNRAMGAQMLNRAVGGMREDVGDDESLLWKTLDIANRPYSTVMGGITGALDPDLGVGEGAYQGLTGERSFSMLDTAEQLGFNPASTKVRAVALAADVLNPLDPLNAVGVGFVNKSAKAGRSIAKATKGAKHADLFTRVSAAEKGLWSPLNVAGQSVVPRSLSVLAAKGADAVADKATRFARYNSFAKHFGGVKKLEEDYPDIVPWLRNGQHETMKSERQFSQTLAEMMGSLSTAGKTDDEIDLIAQQAADLLESPKDKLMKLEGQLADIDAGLYPEVQPVAKTQEEVLEDSVLGALDQKQAQARKAELEDEIAKLSEPEAPVDARTSTLQTAAPTSEFRRSETLLAPKATTTFGVAGQRDTFEIATPYGAKVTGYVGNQDFPGQKSSPYRGEIFRIDVPKEHQKNNIGTSLMRDAIHTLVENGTETVNIHATTPAGRKLVQRLVNRGYIKEKPIRTSESGKNEYALSDDLTARARKNQPVAAGADARQSALRTAAQNLAAIEGKAEPAISDAMNKAFDGLMAERKDELHILKSVVPDPNDLPPRELLLRQREEVTKQIDRITKLHDTATSDAVMLANTLRPMLDEVGEEYLSRLRKYDPKVEFPIEDYLKHMFPAHSARLSRKQMKKAAADTEKLRIREAELRRMYADKGYSDEAIQQAVALDLKKERGIATARPFLDDEAIRGNFPQFKERQHKMTLAELRDAKAAGDFPHEFEGNAFMIADAMFRDSKRWAFAHDLHKFAVDNGYTIKGDDFRQLSTAERKAYVQMDFHLPFVDPSKNPFRDIYIKRDVNQIMQKHGQAMQAFTSSGEWDGLLQMLHGFRRWWSGWTLAPFPAFHVRNVAGDMVLNRLAGLSPAQDLLKAPSGQSAYMAGFALATKNADLPSTDKQWKLAPGNLSNFIDSINAKFPEAEMTMEKLTDYMQKEGIIHTNTLRGDLDLLTMNDTALIKEARKKRPLKAKLGDFMPFAPVERSAIVQGGFKAGQRMQDVTRSALFVHAFKEGLEVADSIDDAMTYATGTVRKHLFDYQDLTSFERDVMRLVIPFYTFTAKNIPLQLEKTLTEPSRQAWINRMFQGAWATGEDEQNDIQYEDLTDWLQESVGMPFRKVKDKDGNDTYSVLTLRGWLPQTELNELAGAFRGTGFLNFVAERMNPAFKEFFEQAMNYDSYLGREIDRGQTVEMFGVEVHPRLQHLLRNLRLVNEIDKMNPGGLWTEIWERTGNATEGAGRPHRREASGMERGLKQLVGLNFYNVNALEEAQRTYLDAQRDAGKSKSAAKVAAKYGQIREYESLMDEYMQSMEKARAAAQRVNQLRREKAMQVAAKNRGV